MSKFTHFTALTTLTLKKHNIFGKLEHNKITGWKQCFNYGKPHTRAYYWHDSTPTLPIQVTKHIFLPGSDRKHVHTKSVSTSKIVIPGLHYLYCPAKANYSTNNCVFLQLQLMCDSFRFEFHPDVGL